MNFKKIVAFGDSWIYGDELLDPVLAREHPDAHFCWVQNTDYRERHCFLGRLGEHYGVPTENFGIPGGSMQSSLWTFLWWINNETLPLQDCLVLVGHTDADRLTFYNPNHVHYSNDPPWNKFVHSTWVHFGSSVVDPEFATMIKQQVVLTNCEDLRKLNYQQTVLTFDGIAARQNLKLFQFNIAPRPMILDNVPTLLWPDFCWNYWFRDHPGNQRRELIKPNGHPNETGHELIRDRLISAVDSCTMYE